jgi:hypothetical protein
VVIIAPPALAFPNQASTNASQVNIAPKGRLQRLHARLASIVPQQGSQAQLVIAMQDSSVTVVPPPASQQMEVLVKYAPQVRSVWQALQHQKCAQQEHIIRIKVLKIIPNAFCALLDVIVPFPASPIAVELESALPVIIAHLVSSSQPAHSTFAQLAHSALQGLEALQTVQLASTKPTLDNHHVMSALLDITTQETALQLHCMIVHLDTIAHQVLI